MSVPEWKKYKPTTVQVPPSPLSTSLYGYIATQPPPKYITTVYDPITRQKKISSAEWLRATRQPSPYAVGGADINTAGFVNDDGIPSKFTSPEFLTHRGGYEPREQFVSEGGLFGEGAGVAGEAEEGLFGEAKGLNWGLIILLLGVGLLFLLAFGL